LLERVFAERSNPKLEEDFRTEGVYWYKEKQNVSILTWIYTFLWELCPFNATKEGPFHAKFNANNTFSHNLHKMLLL
jgi:hypothetical protein